MKQGVHKRQHHLSADSLNTVRAACEDDGWAFGIGTAHFKTVDGQTIAIHLHRI